MQAVRRRWQPLVLAALATVLVIGLVGAMSARGNGDDQEIRFPMVRSAAAANAGCLANASAKVKVENEGAGRGADAQGQGPAAEHGLRLLRDPGAQRARSALSWYQGDFETDRHGRGEQTLRRALQRRDVHRRARGRRSGADGRTAADATHEPGDAAGPHVPPGPVVQLAGRRGEGRLPGHGHAVQRRPHRRHPGAQHPELRRRPGPAAAAHAVGRAARPRCASAVHRGRQRADAAGVETSAPASGHGGYTGTTPLRFHGRSTRLPSAISSARQIVGRVSRGSMTSSIMSLRAAT